MGQEAVVEQTCADALEFLRALEVAYPVYRPPPLNFDPNRWVYRGQASADWPLLPSALRTQPKPFFYVDSRWTNESPATAEAQIIAEYATLRRFFWAADAAGIRLPGDSTEVRRKVYQLRHFLDGPATAVGSAEVWPPDELLGVLALGQHHGLPTRLLDWTRRARVAAYFAAHEALKNPPVGSTMLAVWALNTAALLDHDLWDVGSSNGLAPVAVALPPRSDNPNLHAQSGLFTLQPWHVRGSREMGISREALDVSMRATTIHMPDILRKITMPTQHAKEVLRLLNHDGITAATVFPGTDGVVLSLADELLLA